MEVADFARQLLDVSLMQQSQNLQLVRRNCYKGMLADQLAQSKSNFKNETKQIWPLT